MSDMTDQGKDLLRSRSARVSTQESGTPDVPGVDDFFVTTSNDGDLYLDCPGPRCGWYTSNHGGAPSLASLAILARQHINDSHRTVDGEVIAPGTQDL